MMDCIELVELITDYIESALPPHDRERFEAHLRECPYCVAYVSQMRATLGALGKIPVESISEPAKQRLLTAFRDWKDKN